MAKKTNLSLFLYPAGKATGAENQASSCSIKYSPLTPRNAGKTSQARATWAHTAGDEHTAQEDLNSEASPPWAISRLCEVKWSCLFLGHALRGHTLIPISHSPSFVHPIRGWTQGMESESWVQPSCGALGKWKRLLWVCLLINEMKLRRLALQVVVGIT